MSTPEELLCSRKWRLVQSTWMLLGWVPLALTAWAGYLIIGIRARNWKWLLISAGLLAWLIVWFVWAGTFPAMAKGDALPPQYAGSMSLWTLSSIVVWLGNAVGLQWWVNRKWLVTQAHRAKTGPWYATATSRTGTDATRPAEVAKTIDLAMGSAAPWTPGAASYQLPAPPAAGSSMPGDWTTPVQHSGASSVNLEPLDLNRATHDQLASLPGLDAATVDRIIAARQRLGGFKEPTELVTFAGLKPHLFAAVQARLTVSPTTLPEDPAPRPHDSGAPAGPDTAPSGRRLDF